MAFFTMGLHGKHAPPPPFFFLLGRGGEGKLPTKFSKKGGKGLDKISIFRGGDLFREGIGAFTLKIN